MYPYMTSWKGKLDIALETKSALNWNIKQLYLGDDTYCSHSPVEFGSEDKVAGT